MKKYGKTIFWVVLLVVLIGGSGLLYKNLAGKYKPDALATPGKTAGQDSTEGEGGAQTGVSDNVTDGTNGTEGNDSDSATGNTTGGTGESEDVSGGNGQEAEPEPEPAPDFTVEDMDGNEVKLSDFIGKPIVLNFWASWCGPCKMEMPDFQSMFEIYGEEVNFLMVNLTDGSRETKDTASAFIEKQGYTFPVYYDVNSEGAYAYYVMSVPQTYFIDAEGKLVAYATSAIDAEVIAQGLQMIGVEVE